MNSNQLPWERSPQEAIKIYLNRLLILLALFLINLLLVLPIFILTGLLISSQYRLLILLGLVPIIILVRFGIKILMLPNQYKWFEA